MSKTKFTLPPSARAKLNIPPATLPPSALTRASSSPAITASASSSSASLTNIPTSSTTSLSSSSSSSSSTGIPTPTPTPTPPNPSPPSSLPPAGIRKRRKTGRPHYQLTRRNVSNYDSLASQLLDSTEVTPYQLSPSSVSSPAGPPIIITTSDGEEKTRIRMDVNLSVDVELLPSVHGDLQLSMLCVAVKQDPSKSKTVSGGKRLVGTILRVSDDRELVYRQVVGLTSWREWWWVSRTQLAGLARRKSREKWEDLKDAMGGKEKAIGALSVAGIFVIGMLWLAMGLVLMAMRWSLCRLVCPGGS